MPVDRAFVELNRAQTERIRSLAARLSGADLLRPVGEHWTVAVALAVLDASQRTGKVSAPQIDVVVNDILPPLWRAIPPREAARFAIETAEELDQGLESYPPDLLEQVAAYNQRYVLRTLHRAEHLDEVEQTHNA